MLTVAVFVSLALLCALVKVKRNGGNAGLGGGGAGAALASEATENKRHGALKKGRGVACAMTSSLICINLSLKADWSRAGETEAARAFHPFQRSLSRPQSVCVRVRACADRRAQFHSVQQETRISFTSGRRSVSSKLPPSELLGFLSTFVAGFSRLTVLLSGFRLEKNGSRRR